MRRRVLLSESSSLTAREFVTVLGESGIEIGLLSWTRLPIARFSRWHRRVHEVPSPAKDPVGYLKAVAEIMDSGTYDALLPTHEQAWLFAAGQNYLACDQLPVSDLEAFTQVQSKIRFAQMLDQLNLPQPEWQVVASEKDLGVFGFPVWVKAAFSTAGRGVRKVNNIDQARAVWAELTPKGQVMIQKTAPGRYAQVQGIFSRGRLVGVAASELLATGVGGSAAARLSVEHPQAVSALRILGSHLRWHGGIELDYFHVDGEPLFIECNPRTVEPGNAFKAGVNLPRLLTAVAMGGHLPSRELRAAAGVKTRSTMAMALGAAEVSRSRRAIATRVSAAILKRPPLQHSTEVLTPVVRDPASLIPFVYSVGSVLINPQQVDRLAAGTVQDYSITNDQIELVQAAS